MVNLPLGYQAWERSYAGEPEIKLVNRFLEKNPTNQREKVALLTRPGTNLLAVFDSGGLDSGNRSQFSKVGLFNGDLFVATGPNLYRYASDGTKTHIVGLVNGTGPVSYAWMKGIGYEYLFIADGLLLQVYNGGSHASSLLTKSGTVNTSNIIEIGGTYYAWNDAVDTSTPNGSFAHPWLAKLTGDPMENMAKLINFDGVRGTDFSTALGGPNPQFSASNPGTGPFTQMKITATTPYAAGNAITTTIAAGANLAWTGATLAGGNIHVLQGVEMPDGQVVKALAAVSGFVLAAIGFSQKFYWIEPGEVTVDPLNFAEKESNPDNITDMNTVGDQVIINGDGSTENWYASGNSDAPFLPVEGRVYQRGAIAGTAIQVKDSLCLVGNDGIVYRIGMTGAETNYGVHKISTPAIDERVRVQLRREQGITP